MSEIDHLERFTEVQIAEYENKAKERINSKYTWEYIEHQYCLLFQADN